MSKLLLHPPETTQSFTLNGGCGQPHEYDGEHGIDCPECIEHVRLMSPDDRIAHPLLRGPIVAIGDTPGEIDALTRVAQAKREAASYRLLEADEETAPAGPSAANADEVERLRTRVAELEAGQGTAPPAASGQGVAGPVVPADFSPAYKLGRATAEAGLPPANPYDARKAEGKQWKAGYDSHGAKPEPPKA